MEIIIVILVLIIWVLAGFAYGIVNGLSRVNGRDMTLVGRITTFPLSLLLKVLPK